MKMIKTVIRNILRPATLAVVGLGLLTNSSSAASIKFETKVAGYSTAGWILVLPELRSVLGGKIRYDSSRRCYVTDRVSRGDQIRITISPTTSAERCQNGAVEGIYSAAAGICTWQAVTLPFVKTDKVSTNPAFDNVYVWTKTSSGRFEKRIPIGTR
jgi:hypothetical protein